MRILAGDVGGTKVLLQMIDSSSGARVVDIEQRYESDAWSTFDKLLADFMTRFKGPVDAACFAVAGPVLGDRAEVTNLSWHIDSTDLVQRFPIGRLSLINDFTAVSLGVPLLASGDLVSLNRGQRVDHAPIAILGAGTGLGEANLFYDGDKWNVVPGEGGHADFAPQNEEQANLLIALHQKYGAHVSWERLLSGHGVVNIHNFLSGKDAPYDEEIPVQIAAAAAAGDTIANRTFEIFVDIYGAEAGNMALRTLARGGVFIAGGIAAKNIRHFNDGRFMDAFVRKGRFASLLTTIPVDLVVNQNVGLIGAAEAARRLVS